MDSTAPPDPFVGTETPSAVHDSLLMQVNCSCYFFAGPMLAGILHEQGTAKVNSLANWILSLLGPSPGLIDSARAFSFLAGLFRDLAVRGQRWLRVSTSAVRAAGERALTRDRDWLC